ncbi:hypothetical protein [Planctomycetes bacterium K23_9]|uniref:Uncharacterized protein n=1 Tax=Stieleria marina TaxID=1930275 RepID=A0A517NTU5_9BACT|nr:hypothetical protein K239x_24960 [Planctomycetes bacterium K23_9]
MQRRIVLTVIAILACVFVCTYGCQFTDAGVEQSLRADLSISSSLSIHLIDVTSFPAAGVWGPRQEALFVTSGGARHRLALAYRHEDAPDVEDARWQIGEVGVMYSDGHDEWVVFERTFDHFPTGSEIKSFRDWLDRW